MWKMSLPALLVLAACAVPDTQTPAPTAPRAAPVATAAAPAAPRGARTAAAFDTTTAEQRAAAKVVPAAASEAKLGTTIATLGAPAETGLWLKTALVTSVSQGRVTASNGKSVALELRPAAGGPTQISLSALRLLELPLTAMPELSVYR